MKISAIVFALIMFFSFFTPPVRAETTTNSTLPTQDMEDKIKLLVQENLSTTEAKLKEKVNLQVLVGFAGKISSIGSGNLTLDSHGNLLQVTSTSQTAFLKDGSPIKITSLALGDKVIIIGTAVKDDIIQAKRITAIKDEPALVKTTAVIAKIISINTLKKTITLSLNGTDQVLTLSKKSTVKLNELAENQTILAIVKEYNGALSISRAKVL